MSACVGTANAAVEDDVEQVVSAYFAVPAYADQVLAAVGAGEAEFKKLLKRKFAETFAEPLLGRHVKWLARVQLRGTEVTEVFESWRLAGPRTLTRVTRDGAGNVSATYRVTLKDVYTEVARWPADSDVDSFVDDFKVTNVTREELKARLGRHPAPEIVPLEITGIYDMTFEIVWIGGRGKISEIRKQLISSTLTIHDSCGVRCYRGEEALWDGVFTPELCAVGGGSYTKRQC